MSSSHSSQKEPADAATESPEHESHESDQATHDGHEHHDGHGGHDHTEHHKHMAEDFKRRFWISLVLSLPIIALAPLVQGWLGLKETLAFTGDSYVRFALSVVVFFYGGWPFLKGLVDEVKQAKPGMMTLIGLAITVAFVYSSAVVFGLPGKTFFWELATLVVVMLLGHWIEMRSVIGASKALEELAKLMPSDAHRVKDDGQTEDVKVSDLEKGEKVLVKPGEKVPADGVIVKGETSVNEAMLTGESKPVTKKKDDQVVGGSVNGEGSITVRIDKLGEESYLSQVVDMVKQAQQSKSRSSRLADRAAMWLTFVAIGAGAVTLALWLTLADREFVFALERTVTVMVITCPHALGLAIPLVVAVVTSMAAGAGLLIRDRAAFEQARNIDAVVFDKTGTLTKGEFEVSEAKALGNDTDKDQMLKLAASLEAQSEHPIAQAIAAASDEKEEVDNFEAITGKGAQGEIGGKQVKVVSKGYLDENDLSYDESQVKELFEGGRTVVFVLVDDEVTGAIGLEDVVRDESQEAVKKLHERNIKTMLITGDSREVAQKVAEEIGIDEVFAEVLPDDKSDKIKEVQERGQTVAMVGDGVNDAPALAQADVGVAIGTGTDVAAETADVVLVQSNPLDVVQMLDYSHATRRKMIQNLVWATGYNVVAIPLAAGALYSFGILLSPAVGALLMSLSTVIVAINARLLKVKEVR
jgi:Cu2+-exporting ATPase